MNNNDFELENMREQMATLKKKLEQQEIVNNRMIRQSMKKRVDTITRRYYVLTALGIFMIPYGYWCFIKMAHFSIAFWIGTCIFMLICSAATYYNSRHISDPKLMSRNLLEAREKVARAKKFDANWLLFGIPAIIIWLGCLAYELYKVDNQLTDNPMFWGACCGVVIGTAIGLHIHFKTQRQYQEIIDQIEDLTN